jgi:hypothetical protein
LPTAAQDIVLPHIWTETLRLLGFHLVPLWDIPFHNEPASIVAPKLARRRLQARLIELIETISLQQPETVEILTEPLGYPLLNGELEIQFLDLKQRSFDLVQEVLGALDRLDAGTYGSCLRCDAPVREDILSEMPWTSLCSCCASEQYSLH